VLITLLGLAIWFTLGLTFVSVELERLLERTLTPLLGSNRTVAEMSRQVQTDAGGFLRTHHLVIIGYGALLGLIVLVVAGLILDRRGVSLLGGLAAFLPVYGYFVVHMSFLAGLQALKALWLPFWGKSVQLGDIVYVPYMALVYPAALLGLDIRRPLAYLLMDAGLLILVLGTLAWLYAKFQGSGTADFWIYRYSRHPQYLGWIVWSYGLLLRAAQAHDIPVWDRNPGASLPWVIATVAVICVALGEEVKMRRLHGDQYRGYETTAPFMLPLPRPISRAISFPLRRFLGKERPETRGELVLTFSLYTATLIVFSLPFILLDWPPGRGWMDWPFAS
jgi:protein-S-isoprenylcysteine O-methyltransferase Ste14